MTVEMTAFTSEIVAQIFLPLYIALVGNKVRYFIIF